MDHDVDAEDGVILSRKVFQVGRRKIYPLGVLAQLGLQEEEQNKTKQKFQSLGARNIDDGTYN